ncbi:hypothetical protein KUTeg_023969 [Tegillarca granosa]|uniref:Uncharacterized protein n=1 Tax=Tegillarca granosa TaxID=220873 RepID=A0ABQ9DW00_TEGGR|nr:hypothetical protein KUTeg_023969 [Tegillarca granosa]
MRQASLAKLLVLIAKGKNLIGEINNCCNDPPDKGTTYRHYCKDVDTIEVCLEFLNFQLLTSLLSKYSYAMLEYPYPMCPYVMEVPLCYGSDPYAMVVPLCYGSDPYAMVVPLCYRSDPYAMCFLRQGSEPVHLQNCGSASRIISNNNTFRFERGKRLMQNVNEFSSHKRGTVFLFFSIVDELMSTKAANPKLLGDIAKADPQKLHHVDTQEKNPLPSPDEHLFCITDPNP